MYLAAATACVLSIGRVIGLCKCECIRQLELVRQHQRTDISRTAIRGIKKGPAATGPSKESCGNSCSCGVRF